ncbi:MAG: choice-of-anchor Q domain-containing protein [Akkermansiaceae bacterium]
MTPTGVNLLSDFGESTLTVGPNAFAADPLLAPLGDYGGPTQTMPPLPGSPVIDRASASTVITDQRGVARSVDGDRDADPAPDIGAVELHPLFVTTNNDSGSGSLRDALANAADLGTTIIFDPSVFTGGANNTLTLGGTQLLIDKSLTIDASNIPGGITIDANEQSRIMYITSGQTVALSHLTLCNGDASGASPENIGGAIYNNHATVTLNHSTLSGNSASAFGGGIFSDGRFFGTATLTLNPSTLSGNIAPSGGGIYSGGFQGTAALTLNHSTLSGNSAENDGGGIYSGGFQGTATINLINSIVAANSAPDGPDISYVSGTVTPTGVNLISDLSDTTLTAGPNVLVADPLLAPLGDYGGPTKTMPPQPGSPAIDMASAATALTDQRGAVRSVDGDGDGSGFADIGAVEFHPLFVTSNNDSGSGSLRNAIAEPFASYLAFDPSVFTGGASNTLALGGTQLLIDKSLTIDASDIPGGITIDANKHSRIMEITPGHTVTLSRLTLSNGLASGASPGNIGGAIYNHHATLTLNYSTLSGNSAVFGGGIYSNGLQGTATLTLNHSTLSGNSAGLGGGIYCNGNQGTATLRLNHSTLSGNSATSYGGSIYSIGNQGTATLTLINSIVAANSAPAGPDIRVLYGTVEPTGVNLLSDLADSTLTAGQNVLVADPLLAPLGDYGGPTQVMPPLPGSPAIEGALVLPSTPATDQLGNPRLSGPHPDIGAVEALPLEKLGLASNDGDTIPDLLEGPDGPYPHLEPGTDDSAVDTDGDGSSDADEIADMTNLYDNTDYFRVITFVQVANFDPDSPVMSITIATFPGLSYQFEKASTLENFIPVGDPFVADDFQMTFEVAMESDRDFLRVRRN